MAFAISSGIPPQSRIYCAVVAGFLISALGASKTQIGGPTGAFVVIVGGIVLKYGIEGLYIVTGMAGVLLMLMGVTEFGAAVKFIPRPVVLGFTSGIAVLIASTQIKDFCRSESRARGGRFSRSNGDPCRALEYILVVIAFVGSCHAGGDPCHAEDHEAHPRAHHGAVRWHHPA